MKKSLLLPFAITLGLGLAGTALVLFAWQLPPFSAAQPTTENAYVRGKVTTISPQVSGYIGEVFVADFQTVKAGDLLVRLDAASQQARLQKAEAGLEAAQASVVGAQKALRAFELNAASDAARLTAVTEAHDLAISEQERQLSLKERGVLSVVAVEQANVALSAASARLAEVEAALSSRTEEHVALESQLRSAQASIRREEAEVALARLDLAHTEIVAPTDGRIGQVTARPGQYVAAGTALMSHVGEERWIIANFTETSFHRLQTDQRISFSVDALSGHDFVGHISRFSPATASEFSLMAGTNSTGNFTKVVQRIPVRIEIEAEQPGAEALIPGMSVIVVAH